MKKQIASLMVLIFQSGCDSPLYISDTQLANGQTKGISCDVIGSFCQKMKYDESTQSYTVESTLNDGSTLIRTFTSSPSDSSTSNPAFRETSNTIICPDGTTKTYTAPGSTKNQTCVKM